MNLQQVLTDRNVDAVSIQIYKTTGESSYPAMYSIPVPTSPGSAVLVSAQVEVTNPYDYNVGCGFMIVRDGVTILPAAMMNITPAEHHTVRSFVVWDLPISTSATYVLKGYAAASKVKTGDALKVEPNCGLMQVAVFAPDTLI